MSLIASHGLRAGIVSLICFVVYCFTLSPDVGFTDSGELAAVCTTLGVAHPTGYPLYTILGYLWTLLPLPFSPVFKLNIFAAFCTALSAGLLYWNIQLLLTLVQKTKQASKNKKTILVQESFDDKKITVIAATTSLLYGFSSIIWHQSSGNEVYSLQLVLFTVIIGLFLRAMIVPDGERKRALMIWALTLGLGFGNHGTTILLAPAMLFMFFKRPNEGLVFTSNRFREIVYLALPFLIGLSVWMYLPLRSASLPDFNWGEVHRSWDKFWYHASGKQFQIWMFNGSFSKNFQEFFKELHLQFGIIGLPFMVIGFTQFWKRDKTLGTFALLLVLGCLFYSFNYGIHDIEPYFALAVIGLLFFTAFGFVWFFGLLEKKQLSNAIILGIMCVVPLFNVVLNYQEANKSEDSVVAEYTQTMVQKLPKNTLIISAQWDYWCSSFWYKQSCENLRPDIVLIEKELLRRTWYPRHIRRKYPFLFTDMAKEMDAFEEELEKFESGGAYQDAVLQQRWESMLEAIVQSNYSKRPVYATMDVLQSEQAIIRGYNPIPEGLAFRLIKKGEGYNPINYQPDFTSLALMLKKHKGHLYTGMKDVILANLQSTAYYAERMEKNPEKLKYVNKQTEILSYRTE